ncbi:MAG TPA: DAK2 domain-containing protein [Chloroflexota bacterium]|nr:DAK2 domain-containing protein [Chloroflexota bacterium]
MGETIDAAAVRAGLERIARALAAHADELNALDAAMGDGDMGVTMRLGSQGLLAELAGLGDADAATLVSRAGMAFNRAAASTIGALIATAGMRAGAELKGAEVIDLALLGRALDMAEAGIRARGKAQRGDKTLLDALIPAVEAVQEAATAGAGLSQAGARALAAAAAGCQAAVGLQSRVGRAGWVGERTVGHPDPGASAVVIAIRALVGGELAVEEKV